LPSLDVGGVETGTIDLARYLVEHGHKAITISSGGRLVRELDKINARHYNLPVGKKSPVSVIKMVGKVVEIIRREDIDIVHARSRVPALIAYFACRKTGRILITTAHGYYSKHLLSAVMGWGRYVIVASNIMAKHMVHDFGVPYDRIRLIPRGVDLSRFSFRDPDLYRPKGFTIGMISRITPLKGHPDFIKAVAILNRQIPQLKAIIVGNAPKEKYREDLGLLIRRLGLSRTIEFFAATQDVPAVMKDLDVLVSATTTPEAFGRVIMEAQASGVPVVSTKVGGVVDIVEDGKTGLLCMPQSPKDMAEKVLRLYKDKDLWNGLVKEGRRYVESNLTLEQMTGKTLKVYEEAIKVQNILVIKMSAIGDVILSTPSLKAIRAKFPNAKINALVGVQAREVLDRCPYIDDVIVCDFKERDRGLSGLMRLGKDLRKGCFDIVIDLQNNRKSHILAFLSLAPMRYGYDNKKLSFFLNKRIKDDAPYLDPLEHQFRTLRLAGVKPVDKTLELWPSESDEKYAQKFLEDNWAKEEQALIGINVRASLGWDTKNWPPSYIAELSDRLAKEFKMRTVLTGTVDDVELAGQIAKAAKSKPIVAAGKTSIAELAALMKHFELYITPDSAPLHIASASGIPVIALFGPTEPEKHVVRSDSCVVLCKAVEMKCSPCYKPSCGKRNTCMRKITVDDVLDVIRRYLTAEAG
jgi:lipopolysaccharide heptosyltransferase II